MTIYRWKHEADVMQRALWLSMTNKIAGDLAIRVEWPEIAKKAVELAKSGNVNAMKFCLSIAWPNNGQAEQLIAIENLFDAVDLDDTPKGGE
jgi:hypothetical protein